jgi:hypothetical protein
MRFAEQMGRYGGLFSRALPFERGILRHRAIWCHFHAHLAGLPHGRMQGTTWISRNLPAGLSQLALSGHPRPLFLRPVLQKCWQLCFVLSARIVRADFAPIESDITFTIDRDDVFTHRLHGAVIFQFPLHDFFPAPRTCDLKPALEYQAFGSSPQSAVLSITACLTRALPSPTIYIGIHSFGGTGGIHPALSPSMPSLSNLADRRRRPHERARRRLWGQGIVRPPSSSAGSCVFLLEPPEPIL